MNRMQRNHTHRKKLTELESLLSETPKKLLTKLSALLLKTKNVKDNNQSKWERDTGQEISE